MVNINIDPCRAFSGCRHHLCCHGHLPPCACGDDTLLARESLGNLVSALRHPLHSDVTNPHSRPQTTGNMKENYVLFPFSLVCVLKPLVSFFIYFVFFFRFEYVANSQSCPQAKSDVKENGNLTPFSFTCFLMAFALEIVHFLGIFILPPSLLQRLSISVI